MKIKGWLVGLLVLLLATHLYVSTIVAGTSFTVTTANAAAAAGTENFNYIIIN